MVRGMAANGPQRSELGAPNFLRFIENISLTLNRIGYSLKPEYGIYDEIKPHPRGHRCGGAAYRRSPSRLQGWVSHGSGCVNHQQ